MFLENLTLFEKKNPAPGRIPGPRPKGPRSMGPGRARAPKVRRQVHESEVPRILRRGLKCHHVQCQQYLLVFQDGKSFPSKLMAQLI